MGGWTHDENELSRLEVEPKPAESTSPRKRPRSSSSSSASIYLSPTSLSPLAPSRTGSNKKTKTTSTVEKTGDVSEAHLTTEAEVDAKGEAVPEERSGAPSPSTYYALEEARCPRGDECHWEFPQNKGYTKLKSTSQEEDVHEPDDDDDKHSVSKPVVWRSINWMDPDIDITNFPPPPAPSPPPFRPTVEVDDSAADGVSNLDWRSEGPWTFSGRIPRVRRDTEEMRRADWSVWEEENMGYMRWMMDTRWEEEDYERRRILWVEEVFVKDG